MPEVPASNPAVNPVPSLDPDVEQRFINPRKDAHFPNSQRELTDNDRMRLFGLGSPAPEGMPAVAGDRMEPPKVATTETKTPKTKKPAYSTSSNSEVKAFRESRSPSYNYPGHPGRVDHPGIGPEPTRAVSTPDVVTTPAMEPVATSAATARAEAVTALSQPATPERGPKREGWKLNYSRAARALAAAIGILLLTQLSTDRGPGAVANTTDPQPDRPPAGAMIDPEQWARAAEQLARGVSGLKDLARGLFPEGILAALKNQVDSTGLLSNHPTEPYRPTGGEIKTPDGFNANDVVGRVEVRPKGSEAVWGEKGNFTSGWEDKTLATLDSVGLMVAHMELGARNNILVPASKDFRKLFAQNPGLAREAYMEARDKMEVAGVQLEASDIDLNKGVDSLDPITRQRFRALIDESIRKRNVEGALGPGGKLEVTKVSTMDLLTAYNQVMEEQRGRSPVATGNLSEPSVANIRFKI